MGKASASRQAPAFGLFFQAAGRRLPPMRYRFVQDAQVAGALQVVTVRSQRASASLAAIELPEVPAGVTVVLAGDIPGSGVVEYEGRRMPVLARDTVAYVGEPVALVASRDLALAQTVASELALRYLELPQSVDAVEPIVETVTRGDPASSFARAERVVAHGMSTAPRRFAPPAPQEAVAFWDGQTLVVRTATQHPFHVRATVASVLDLQPSRVRVVAEPLDGPCGKLLVPSLVAAHAALVAFRANAPARVRYSLREELSVAFRIAGTRGSWQATVGSGERAGAARFRLDIEGGAYDLMAEDVIGRVVGALSGPYRWEAVSAEGAHHTGETVPCELPPGCGELEAVFVRELCVNAVAEAAGMDPVAWRLANLQTEPGAQVQPAEARRPKASRHRTDLRGVIEEVARRSDFHRRFGAYEAVRARRAGSGTAGVPLRGVGIALATFAAGLGSAAQRGAKMRLGMAKDRRVTVWSSAVDTGRGTPALFTRIVSEELGIPAGQVTVSVVDTSLVPSSGPAAASRTAAILVPLLRRCCASLKARMRRAALPLVVESQFRGGREPEGPVSASGTVAAVEVDPVSRLARCTGIWTVIDAGEILDPRRAESAAASGLVRGLSVALIEESDAALVPVPPASDAFAAPAPSYRTVRHADLGQLWVGFLDGTRQRARAEPAAVSELALLGVAPAVAAAVAQATGLRISRLPIGPLDLAPAAGGET